MSEEVGNTTATVCSLCKGEHHQLNSSEQWRNEAAQKYVSDLGIPQGGLVYNACRKDITRAMNDDRFTPRWCKTKGTCVVDGCEDRIFSTLHKNIPDLPATLAELRMKVSATPTPAQLPLCKAHYKSLA